MGREAAAVRGAYLDAGFLPDPSAHLPPDHLSLELGFLGVLAGRAADSSGADAGLARDAWWNFTANHLAPWLALWEAGLRRAEAHPFYLGVAGFISEILEADLAWLDELRNLSVTAH
jgi:TorA maturation chaperone TorD